MTTVGIVGTGMLGEAVGLHLMDVGYKVIVFNRTKEKTKKLEKKGARILDSPKQVAENSELVITIVKDAKAVREVIFGDSGIIDGKQDRKSTRLNSSHQIMYLENKLQLNVMLQSKKWDLIFGKMQDMM